MHAQSSDLLCVPAAADTAGRLDEQPRAQTVTLRPAPRREPPFDDELTAAGVVPPTRYDRPLPFPAPAPPVPLHIVSRRSDLPDPMRWAHRMMVGVVEASAGKRPLQQLSGMMTPSIFTALRRDFSTATARPCGHWMRSATVRTVSGCEPADGVAELCATLHTPSRVHAVALRAELRHGAWRCVRLQIG